jgi:hypothetical protein
MINPGQAKEPKSIPVMGMGLFVVEDGLQMGGC